MHKIIKLKLTLTLILTLTDTGGAVLTLMLGYRSFIHYIGTPQKNLHKKSFAAVSGSGWAKSTV